MARRYGRKGDHLATDDYTGFTEYASNLKRDYWGNYARKPLKRNLQEIALPLNDPQPVSLYRGPNYEPSNGCIAEIAPKFVGNTDVPTSQSGLAFQIFNLDPAIPDMAVGCSFIVRGEVPGDIPATAILDENGNPILDENGNYILSEAA